MASLQLRTQLSGPVVLVECCLAESAVVQNGLFAMPRNSVWGRRQDSSSRNVTDAPGVQERAFKDAVDLVWAREWSCFSLR